MMTWEISCRHHRALRHIDIGKFFIPESWVALLLAFPRLEEIRGKMPKQKDTFSPRTCSALSAKTQQPLMSDGFNMVARAGTCLQEIHVTTPLSRTEMKEAIKRVLDRLP